MDIFDEDLSLEEIKSRGTGGYEFIEGIEIVPFEFDRFIVDVILSSSDKFLGIKDVKINKDFLSNQQRIDTMGYHDVEEYYKE